MKPRIATLISSKKEAENVRSFTFAFSKLHSAPGQFVMLWIPGIDQKPFSIAEDTEKTFTVTVFKIGTFTNKLWTFKKGDQIGVSGPFGKPYQWKPQTHIIAVGGGYGAAPLAYLLRKATENKCTVELLLGARRKNLLLYTKKFPKQTAVATDDGSAGHKGFVTELLEQRLKALSPAQKKRTVVCVCGPEPMEVAAARMAKKYGVPSQISIERYIKCGIGVCGQCCIDDSGEPMCQCGPVISGKKALSLEEFGAYHRDASGQKQYYKK
ncbi:MAG TPA: dihydroorotate dehydrogenase electron transfer subunit [Patescibacteria group bacterium]|nr:dihydroorotate dehydrogenase electron transfer subunit [Patescibacteria group bacterium]